MARRRADPAASVEPPAFSAVEVLNAAEEGGGLVYLDKGQIRRRILAAMHKAYRMGEEAGFERGKTQGQIAKLEEQVQRFAARWAVGGRRVYEEFDPYQGLTPKAREFAEKLDLWTLEQIIVRVMTEIDRRRRKYQSKLAQPPEEQNP